MQIRQGDLLFIKLDKTPVKLKNHERILVHGELTGHHHAVQEEDLMNCDIFLDTDGRLIVKAFNPVTVVHQEHAPAQLVPGTWEVRRQAEYQPQRWIPVAD